MISCLDVDGECDETKGLSCLYLGDLKYCLYVIFNLRDHYKCFNFF